jgi:predicted Zn-dependent peptidase
MLNKLSIHYFLCWCLIVLFSWGIFSPVAEAKLGTEPAAQSIQPYLDRVRERITEFSLDNGIKFIVLENHQAPLVSFVTYADVGGANEPDGQTGVAHFLEHLAFKGTKDIGTTNYPQEKAILTRLDQIFAEMKNAESKGDEAKLVQLKTELEQLQIQASKYVKQNEFGQIVETAGGVGLNAATSPDYTKYYYSFPANKLELWMSLESERFLEPVFREFYSEKQVILEERKLRTDNSPIGKMVERFLDTAFTQHPYKRPVIGYEADLANLTRENVEDFFATYYGASNLTFAIVGDVEPTEVKRLAQTYFGRFPPTPKPPPLEINEPPQTKTREVTLEYPSQPWYLEGYHIPGINDPDYVVYDLLSAILSNGRTSRLYQSLVEEQKIALAAAGYSGFPGDKYPNLMLFYVLTAPDRSLDEVATALKAEIERLKTEPVSPEELERVKTQARADLLRAVDSNSGMASLLAEYEAKTDSWRNLFTRLDAIASVTSADIQLLAQQTFTPKNRTIGRLLTKE